MYIFCGSRKRRRRRTHPRFFSDVSCASHSRDLTYTTSFQAILHRPNAAESRPSAGSDPVWSGAGHQHVQPSARDPRFHRVHWVSFTYVQHLVSVSHDGYQNGLHDLIQLLSLGLISPGGPQSGTHKGNRGSRGGLHPTQPLHTLGYYLQVEQHAVLLSLMQGCVSSGFSTCHRCLAWLSGATSRVSTQQNSAPKSRNPPGPEALPQLCTSRHVHREQASQCHLPRPAQPWPGIQNRHVGDVYLKYPFVLKRPWAGAQEPDGKA